MKAVYIKAFGGIENIEVGEVEEPRPLRGEVRVVVKAAGVNHLDVWVRRGRPGLSLEGKAPHVLGSDASGIVDALGEEVDGVAVGDEVLVNPGVSCGQCEFCKRGNQSECPGFKLLGFQLPGTYAEKVVLPASNVSPKPAHLSWAEAAALPLAHITAWRMLFARAQFKAGESVLIHGIGGGAALAALQLVLGAGGEAIVTSSSDEKLTRAKNLGAHHGVNYKSTEDVGEAVKAFTKGRGVDLVFDTVGAATLPISMKSLRRGGRIVTCGITGGREANVNLQMLYWNHHSLIGSTMGAEEDMRRMLRFVNATQVKPVLDKTYSLKEYAEAVKRMEAGLQFGKLVLQVDC